MISIRGTQILNINDFDFKSWCEGLGLDFDALNDAYIFAKKCAFSHEKLLFGIEIAEILQSLNMDQESIKTAILYGVDESDEIEEIFGKNIARLLHGVKEMDHIRLLNSEKATNIDNIRRMLLAMVDDFRCVVIKLAERIVYLRDNAKSFSEEEKVIAAKECSKIYAPLANRLGIGQLKWELEDYCFRILHPQKYHIIAKQLKEKRLDREAYIEDFVNDLKLYLGECGIKNAQVYGRPKHIFSIYKKMQKKHIEFNELYDVRAVRVIVEKLQDCYAALGAVHTHFRHIPQEFDDYVANPKPNGYQSIHTVVLGKEGKIVEVQIRTAQMHDDAELGVAAHWKYKEGITKDRSSYESKIAWLRKLIAWQDDINDSNEIIAEVRSQIFDDRVYVFTPLGEVIDLAVGSTPLDFAYAVHTQIGHRCIGAKVGGKIVPLTYNLQMGDQVEILTQKNPNPSRDWLNASLGYVKSSKARSKINGFFKNQALQVETKEPQTRKQIVKKRNDEQILKEFSQKKASFSHEKQNQIIVEGVGNLLHYKARCCSPIFGDKIAGYITIGRGISIHKASCEQFLKIKEANPERIVEASWE